MKVMIMVGMVMLLAIPAKGQDSIQIDGTKVHVAKVNLDSAYADSLWTYDKLCSGLDSLNGHGLRNVTWFFGNLLETKSDYGYWLRDSIILDTALNNSLMKIRNDIIAHELLHQLLQGRVPKQNTFKTDSLHPFYPFIYPCRLVP